MHSKKSTRKNSRACLRSQNDESQTYKTFSEFTEAPLFSACPSPVVTRKASKSKRTVNSNRNQDVIYAYLIYSRKLYNLNCPKVGCSHPCKLTWTCKVVSMNLKLQLKIDNAIGIAIRKCKNKLNLNLNFNTTHKS